MRERERIFANFWLISTNFVVLNCEGIFSEFVYCKLNCGSSIRIVCIVRVALCAFSLAKFLLVAKMSMGCFFFSIFLQLLLLLFFFSLSLFDDSVDNWRHSEASENKLISKKTPPFLSTIPIIIWIPIFFFSSTFKKHYMNLLVVLLHFCYCSVDDGEFFFLCVFIGFHVSKFFQWFLNDFHRKWKKNCGIQFKWCYCENDYKPKMTCKSFYPLSLIVIDKHGKWLYSLFLLIVCISRAHSTIYSFRSSSHGVLVLFCLISPL